MEGEINNNFENEEGPKKDKLEIIMEEDHNEKYYSTVKKNYNQEKKESINKNTIIKPELYNINLNKEKFEDNDIISSGILSYGSDKEEVKESNKILREGYKNIIDTNLIEDDITDKEFDEINNSYKNYNNNLKNNNKTSYNDENKLQKYFIMKNKDSMDKISDDLLNNKDLNLYTKETDNKLINTKNDESEPNYDNNQLNESYKKSFSFNRQSKNSDNSNILISENETDNRYNKKDEDNENSDDENEVMELYSYEGTEKENSNDKDNNNDGINEEYYINKKIIEFQRKNNNKNIFIDNLDNDINIIKKEKLKIGKTPNINKKQIYKNDKFFSINNNQKKSINNIQLNNNKKKSEIIQLNNFKINNYSINFFNNNKGEIKNKNTSKSNISNKFNKVNNSKEKENRLLSIKEEMRIFELIMAKKKQKEKNEKTNRTFDEKYFKNNENRNTEKNNINKINLNKFLKTNESYKEKNILKHEINNINDNKINKEINLTDNNKIYAKNNKIPYKKIQITINKNNYSLNKNKENNKSQNKSKVVIEKILEYNKFKRAPNIEIMYNTDPTSINKDKKKIHNTLFKNYIGLEQSNKRKNNIFNKKENTLIWFQTKPCISVENSYDTMSIYKKRIIKNKYFSVSTSPRRIYSNKMPLIKKRNIYSKYNLNNHNNMNINTINKNQNKLPINANISPSSINYLKKNATSKNTIFNNLNNFNKCKNNMIKTNIKNKINKTFFSSKTSNNSKQNIKDSINYNNDMELSYDNIRYTQYIPAKNCNNIYMNYINNKSFNSINSYRDKNKTFNDNNQSLSFIYQNKNKNNIRKKLLINNSYYDDKNNTINFNKNEIRKYSTNESNNNYSVDDADNNKKKNDKNNLILINIEDIIKLVEKLNEIIYLIKNKKEVKKQCHDYWTYFFNSYIYQKIEKICKNEKDLKIIRISIKYELLSILLCYELSFDKNVLNKTFILLLELLELNYYNLMIICQNILNKICKENKVNEWVLKLNKVIKNSKNIDEHNNKNKPNIDKINFINEKLSIKINNVLLNFKTEYNSLIMSLKKKIIEKNYEQINDFFQEYILRKDNSHEGKNDIKNQKISVFVPFRLTYNLTKRVKPFTLILGLEKTLINFQKINNNQGVLKFRPFLIEFLEILSQYYEFILFSSESLYYTESIIKAIQQKKTYFDYIFYRENNKIFGNEYIIDIKKIGRPLNSTIIIDNYSQNNRLQKENRINIKSFLAQDTNDRVLYNLILILINIAKEKIDVRYGLLKYRDEIFKKIA